MSFEAFVGSIPGPHHRRSGELNQDAVVFHDEHGRFYGALADGAGSLKFAEAGARLAVETALKSMTSAHPKASLASIVQKAYEEAREAVLELSNFKEYGSTLVLFAGENSGNWSSLVVGDSFLVVSDGAEHNLVTAGGSGEYANGTELLTSADPTPVLASGEKFAAVSLSSDGLESVGISKGAAHGGFWSGIHSKAAEGSLEVDRLFAWLESLERIVDDTTLLTVVRR